LFHRSGERVADEVYRIDDDFFLERVVRAASGDQQFTWHGRRYTATVPTGPTLPLFLVIEGVSDPPPGELVLVLLRPPSLLDIFRPAGATSGHAVAKPG
jgi:hypothetical protein